MSSVPIPRAIRMQRQAAGLTQAALARRASVSLATMRDIEAGRATPSPATMRRLFEVLDLEVAARSRTPADWSVLVHFGLPLAEHREADATTLGPADLEAVPREVRRAARVLASGAGGPHDARLLDALGAWLLALRGHFPSTYRRWFAGDDAVGALVPRTASERHIKLARMARERLAEVL